MENLTPFDILFDIAPQQVQQKLLDNKGLRENPKHHPEPNAFEHIKIVTNRLTSTGDIDLTIAGFFHDICKMETATPREGSPYFLCADHEKKAVAFALRHAIWIQSRGADLGKVIWIIDNHMRIKNIDSMKGYKKWEIKNNKWFPDLEIFTQADNMNLNWEENWDLRK